MVYSDRHPCQLIRTFNQFLVCKEMSPSYQRSVKEGTELGKHGDNRTANSLIIGKSLGRASSRRSEAATFLYNTPHLVLRAESQDYVAVG